MANITVKVPDDVYRRARVRAAELGTSVSAMVADFLTSATDLDSAPPVQRLQREVYRRVAEDGYRASDRFTRDDLYDRDLMRSLHEASRGRRDGLR